MYKLFVITTVLALAHAKPSGLIAPAPLAAPVAYAAPAVAHATLAYAAAAPAIAYAAPAVSYAAPAAAVVRTISAPVAVPAPVSYATGVQVSYHTEPVEQHGYKIVY